MIVKTIKTVLERGNVKGMCQTVYKLGQFTSLCLTVSGREQYFHVVMTPVSK